MKQNEELTLTAQQQEYLNWLCIAPQERVPNSKRAFAEQMGVDITTLRRWQKKDIFVAQWKTAVDDIQGSPERTQRLLDTLYSKALEGDVKSAQLYLQATNRMATFSKLALQPAGTTGDGLGITVVATATAGTAIHTASATPATIDELWLYAANIHSSAVVLTIEYGGVSVTKDLIQQSIAATPSGLVLICAGLVVQGNATQKVVRAFADTASKIEIFGFVNRITA
jgi:hypothetical protein